jgi:hypothetical protein
MIYCDSRCSQTLTGLLPSLPGALLCNGQLVILRQRVRGSVRAVRAVRNTRVFQTETRVVADVGYCLFHTSLIPFFTFQPGTSGDTLGFCYLPLEVPVLWAAEYLKDCSVRYQLAAELNHSDQYILGTFV